MSYVGNKNSGIVHVDLSDCIENMFYENAVYFDDLTHALGDGYEECRVCLNSGRAEHYAKFKTLTNAVRAVKYSECLICAETRGVQRAHIIPRRNGGVDLMPLCPTCHWNYDHAMLNSKEIKKLKRYLDGKYNSKFVRKIVNNLRKP